MVLVVGSAACPRRGGEPPDGGPLMPVGGQTGLAVVCGQEDLRRHDHSREILGDACCPGIHLKKGPSAAEWGVCHLEGTRN